MMMMIGGCMIVSQWHGGGGWGDGGGVKDYTELTLHCIQCCTVRCIMECKYWPQEQDMRGDRERAGDPTVAWRNGGN